MPLNCDMCNFSAISKSKICCYIEDFLSTFSVLPPFLFWMPWMSLRSFVYFYIWQLLCSHGQFVLVSRGSGQRKVLVFFLSRVFNKLVAWSTLSTNHTESLETPWNLYQMVTQNMLRTHKGKKGLFWNIFQICDCSRSIK